MTDALTWAGTYHGIGARLLREYAEQIGLDPAFTIHDREDSAGLMNLVSFSKTENRFPTKGTCLSIYSRCVNAEMPIEQVIGTSYPWCSGWASELKELFAAYVEAKKKQNVLDYDDLLLYWAQMVSDANLADDIGGRFDHVLVDEYLDTNRLQSSILLALKPGGRGLTVVGDEIDLLVSRGDTLTLWASSLRDIKQRVRPLFRQERVAASAGQFLDGLLGGEPRKTGWMRAEAAGDPGPWRQQAILGRGQWDADALRDIVGEYALETLCDEQPAMKCFLEVGYGRCHA